MTHELLHSQKQLKKPSTDTAESKHLNFYMLKKMLTYYVGRQLGLEESKVNLENS